MKTVALIAIVLLARTAYTQQPSSELERTIQELLATIEQRDQRITELEKQLGVQKPEPAYKITLLTMPGCFPCDQADAYHGPRYRATGWAWEKVMDPKPRGTYPRYRICGPGWCEELQCTSDQLDNRISGMLFRHTQ